MTDAQINLLVIGTAASCFISLIICPVVAYRHFKRQADDARKKFDRKY